MKRKKIILWRLVAGMRDGIITMFLGVLHVRIKWLLLSLLFLLLTAGAIFEIGVCTSATSYCGSCHEMTSYLENLKQSSHYKNASGQTTQCVDCHISPGAAGWIRGKFKGLQALYQHWQGMAQKDPAQWAARVAAIRERLYKEMPQQNCTHCHTRLAPSAVFDHATLPGTMRCLDCHRKNNGYFRFDHATTGFALAGQHRNTACRFCHEQGFTATARRTENACQQCHQDIHQGTLGNDCASCHTEESWKLQQTFVHDNTAYPLVGKHRQVGCGQCHRDYPRQLKISARACQDCHVLPANHSQTARDCAACHSEENWRQIVFRPDAILAKKHGLEGGHQHISCSKCHTDKNGLLVFQATSPACRSCHEDIHQGQFKTACDACHSTAGWKTPYVRFDHRQTNTFALQDRHLQTACEKCHQNGQWKGLATRCAGCHADPHDGTLQGDCSRCHNAKAWTGKDMSFRHQLDREFSLAGKHSSLDCRACHAAPAKVSLAKTRFTGTPKTCNGCHADPHAGKLLAGCATCHLQDGWKVPFLQFDHNRHAAYAITPLHQQVTCAQCHGSGAAVRYKPLLQNCEACHKEIAQFMQGNFAGIRGTVDYHAKIACVDCHPGSRRMSKLDDYAATCVPCHQNKTTIGTMLVDWPSGFAEVYGKIRNLPKLSSNNRNLLALVGKYKLHNIRFSHKLLMQLPTYQKSSK